MCEKDREAKKEFVNTKDKELETCGMWWGYNSSISFI